MSQLLSFVWKSAAMSYPKGLLFPPVFLNGDVKTKFKAIARMKFKIFGDNNYLQFENTKKNFLCKIFVLSFQD